MSAILEVLKEQVTIPPQPLLFLPVHVGITMLCCTQPS